MTRNHKDDDYASTRKWFKTCDNGGAVPWSNLNHDVLFLVINQLKYIDFVSFSGVCKTWRSFALSNRHRFMATRPPLHICISSYYYNEKECYQVDFEGRNLKTLHPYSPHRTCYGLTCGYFVFYEHSDFWLVNPVTRHELHFPNFHFNMSRNSSIIKTILLVFSPLINRWVFMVLRKISSELWFCIEGKGKWNHISSPIPIIDVHAFKGKVYTLNTSCVCELRLAPEPKLTILEIKNFPKEYMNMELDFSKGIYPKLEMVPAFASLDERLYLKDCFLRKSDMVMELDFGEMQWVSPKEQTKEKCNCFIFTWQYGGGIIPGAGGMAKCQKAFASSIWHFPNSCLDVNLINES